MRGPTASCVLTWPAIGLASLRGIRVEETVRSVGLRPAELVDARSRVPLSAVHALWQSLSLQLKDPALGVSALLTLDAGGPSSWPEPFSLLERLLRSSRTVREGIECLTRYSRLVRDEMSCQVEESARTSLLSFEFADDEPPLLAQLHVGMVVLLARRVLPGEPLVHEIWFKEPEPPCRSPYNELFGVPVRFGAQSDGVLSGADALATALPGASEGELRTLLFRADAWLAELPVCAGMVERVRDAVLQGLASGDTSVQAIAKRLGVSPRTLNRRLQAEGHSFQSVYDKVRCELAKRDLVSGGSVREVGQRVGFSNVSAFYRAFKAWTGYTPTEFQRRRFLRPDSALQ